MSKIPNEIQKIINELYEKADTEDRDKLDLLARNLHSKMAAVDQGEGINCESLVSEKDQKPYVILSWEQNRAQLTPQEARTFAMGIFEVAEASVQDAAIYDFAVKSQEGKEDASKYGISMIIALREHRKQFEA